MNQAVVADYAIDISGEICPMTYVRTRLALDGMASGQILAVTLHGEDPRRNVPLSARRQGHIVLGEEVAADGGVLLLIQRK